jgi:hypothetical protein
MNNRRNKRRYQQFLQDAGDDPMGGVANLFDVAMVFAVALILGVLNVLNVPDLLSASDVTIVKNAGQDNMEIIQKKGVKLEKYTMSAEELGGDGLRLGVCYRLENGEMVYVPDTGAQEAQTSTAPDLSATEEFDAT